MELLKQRILAEGFCLPGNILKVDSFLNHQIDPELTLAMGKEFARRFEGTQIDKVVTVESSGIAIGLAVAAELGTKLVFARTVQLRDYDGRFRSENKDYAAAVPVRNVSADINADMTQSYNLNVHPVVIDAALSAFRKMEQSRKPSIRKRLEESRKAPEKTTQQREHTQKRSSEHEL